MFISYCNFCFSYRIVSCIIVSLTSNYIVCCITAFATTFVDRCKHFSNPSNCYENNGNFQRRNEPTREGLEAQTNNFALGLDTINAGGIYLNETS